MSDIIYMIKNDNEIIPGAYSKEGSAIIKAEEMIDSFIQDNTCLCVKGRIIDESCDPKEPNIKIWTIDYVGTPKSTIKTKSFSVFMVELDVDNN
jgi:hypothetical protein